MVWVSAAAILPAMGQAPLGPLGTQCPAECELHHGIEAYKMAQYDEAIIHFQKAVDLDPNLPKAELYLGTALAQNVIPGLDTPGNLQSAQQAVDVFEQVLQKNPHDVNAMKQIAGLEFSVKRLDEARTWQKKVLDESPSDAEAAYTIGVIDWTQAHQNAARALEKAGLTDDGMGNTKAPAAVLDSIAKQNDPLVDEGLRYLTQAIANRPDYDDAMAYLNLTYRRKADVDWHSQSRREDDLANAREWTSKAMEARRAREEKSQARP